MLLGDTVNENKLTIGKNEEVQVVKIHLFQKHLLNFCKCVIF